MANDKKKKKRGRPAAAGKDQAAAGAAQGEDAGKDQAAAGAAQGEDAGKDQAAAGAGKGKNTGDFLDAAVQRQSGNKKRPVGRPRKEGDNSRDPREEKKKKEKEKIVEDPELIDIAAQASADAQIGLLSAIFGPRFGSGYYGKDDNEILAVGFKYWYRVRGVPFPAWAVFVLCQLAYFGIRFGDPANRQAVKNSFAKFRGKIIDAKEVPKQPAPGTQPAPASVAAASSSSKPIEDAVVVDEVAAPAPPAAPPAPGADLRRPIGGNGEADFLRQA